MKDFDDDPESKEKEEVNEALEQVKAALGFLISKKMLRGYALVLIACISWMYTDFFKLPDACYEAQPKFNMTLSIKNPNMRWEEFQGLELKGIVRSFGSDGKKAIIRSYDMLTGKPDEEGKKFLLNGFINSYDTKVNGCVESATVFAHIKTLSGAKAVLNGNKGAMKFEQKFLSTKKQKASHKRTKNKRCKVELVVNPIDPIAQGAQVPKGNMKMSCS
ncbi:MAG: hypothetical protein F3743_09375 [Nitrospinae bacterium]|nr:hypothetical protein [Nitrospinota bacterium]MZH05593.1 hypothetical protein [Nitrospinota bacterium]MZH15138.1 hypothetical protein [Nitrospinota bacterium]